MNILTKRGLSSLKYEEKAIGKWMQIYPGYDFIHTPKDRYSAVDGMLYKKRVLDAVVETRTRNITRQRLRDLDDTLIVTLEKIHKGKQLSQLLCVPFVFLVYLIPEDRLFTFGMTNNHGEWAFDFVSRKTITQRNINGGTAERTNAFLPMTKAKEHK